MVRRALPVCLAAVVTLGLAQGAAAVPSELPDPGSLSAVSDVAEQRLEKGTVLTLGAETEHPELYIVQLADAAVPAYTGDLAGLPATNPAENGTARLDAAAAPAQDYREHLRAEHAELTAAIARETGRTPDVERSYTDALNGIAVTLTRDEARAVAELPGVVAVQVDEERQLQTDVGPGWIGAPAIWDGSGTPSGTEGATQGEGVVVGIIDSGINPANPSFAATVAEADGGDGYVHTNPLGAGTFRGVCDPANTDIYVADWGCNDKLIGAWSFTTGEPGSPYDGGGHGTHTASTSAGNQVEATTYSARGTDDEFSATRTIRGVAPHANVIAYDVCVEGCSLAAIIAGIDQAIRDGVDVINYSIGSDAASAPWSDPDALGYLNARAAGIYVATSAGNSGPGEATVGSPADVPWITSVGAAQHNRQWQAEVRELTADGGATLPDLAGLGFSAPTGAAFPLVDAADLGSATCVADDLAGNDLTGKIAVCERGVTGRVEKGGVVAALGAEGMILVNDEASGDSLNADAHLLPAVHVGYDDGVALKEWMAGVTGEQASLSGGIEVISDDLGDIMAAFSSRGPNRAVDVVSPSLSAPGVDILAGAGSDNEVVWEFMSGTSMASPHVAGSFALLSAVHGDDWTPAEAQSALMTTSRTDVTDNDGTPADWFDMGSGRADLTVAANAGLVLDVSTEDYRAADPAQGGDVKDLNLASMANSQCLQTCSWTRTVTGTATGAGSWSVSTESVTDGVTVSVEPATFTIAEGEDVDLTVTADVSGAATDAHQFGSVVITPDAGTEAPVAHLPVAVLPSTGVLPDEITIDTRRDAGSQESPELESIEITNFTATATGLVPAQEEGLEIVEDTTNTDPYDGNGTQTVLVDVPADAARLVTSLAEATAPDLDLFVGTGSEPSLASEVCRSTTAGSAESCDIGAPAAGGYWILVQNWEASAAGGTDTATLSTAVVSGDAGNLTVEGSASNPAGEPFTVRAFYDEPALEAGQTWYGAITLGSAPDAAGDIGTIPVTVNRHDDDVTKTASTDTAAPGDTVTYTLTVAPNVTPADLAYTITDTLPDGVSYVEGSATAGATVTDGALSWEGTLPTAVGAQGDYTVTTSADDTSCVNPFTGTAEYVDLAEYGIPANSGVVGDGVAFTAFADKSFGFYGTQYTGLGFSDDGFLMYDVPAHYGGEPGTPQALPDVAAPNNVAAMLWQDMQITYDAATNTGVSLATAGDLAIVEYDDLRLAGDPTGAQGTYDLEAFVVNGSNDIVLAYDNLTGPLAGPVTIGTEDGAGAAATALVNNATAESVVADDMVVCMTYGQAGLDPVEITYQVTVDDDVTDGQVLTNEAVHVTDDPGAQPVVASAEVTAVVDEPVPATVTVEATTDAVEPATDGVFTFTRPDGSAAGELTVTYVVADGRYTKPGRDYRPLDGEVTFAAGETTATETVEVIDRRGRSPKERTVTVTIEAGEGYEIGDPAEASITIVDDWKN